MSDTEQCGEEKPCYTDCMNDTVFGKIIRGEIPTTKVYEDEQCLAFMDIKPVTKGHIVLIPKEQYRWLHDIPDKLLAHLIVQTKVLMKGMIAGLGCDLVQLVVVGEEVEHAHIHLIPRMHGNDVGNIHPQTSYNDEAEKESFAEKIKNGLR